jgi:hypothetical protein
VTRADRLYFCFMVLVIIAVSFTVIFSTGVIIVLIVNVVT